MTHIFKISILCTFFAVFAVNGQQTKQAKADKKFNNYAFADAIASYERLVEKGYSSEDIYKKLGDANYMDARYKKASEWYKKLFAANKRQDAEYVFRYAQCLKSLGNYEESDRWMEKFEKLKASDSRALKFSQNKDYLLKIKEKSGRYDIENLEINSNKSDFSPSLTADMLVFSTARDSGIIFKKVNSWDKAPYLNLHGAKRTGTASFEKPVKFSKTLNTQTHESSSVFTKDGNTVYFTRNNSKNGKFVTDANGLSRLKLYRATKQNDIWTNIEELPFNSNAHSTAHPALSADDTQLYFASDMPGTVGESDIYSVDISADGSFGTPKNLGSAINTEGRETFPYVTESDVLYFASDGHPGLGGLDIFATLLGDPKSSETPSGNPSAPIIANIGAPVNSEEDDFSFIIDEKTKNGFFASNRDGGKGSDDIYALTETIPLKLDCNTSIEGTVRQLETKEPLAAVKVILYNDKEEAIAETISDDAGTFSFEQECIADDFKLVGTKTDYRDGTRKFTMIKGQDVQNADIEMTKIMKEAPVDTNLTELLNIATIYFDYDKAVIRKDVTLSLEKIIAYLNKFPNVKIEIGSHTDSRGKDAYNLDLSNRRAKATVKYLVDGGVDAARVEGKGYGETQLNNKCSNGVPCSVEEHQENRRSEFVIQE